GVRRGDHVEPIRNALAHGDEEHTAQPTDRPATGICLRILGGNASFPPNRRPSTSACTPHRQFRQQARGALPEHLTSVDNRGAAGRQSRLAPDPRRRDPWTGNVDRDAYDAPMLAGREILTTVV